jgi:mannosyltransferase
MTAAARPAELSDERSDEDLSRLPVHRWDAVLLGIVGAVVAGFGFWIPDFWADEEATYSALDRPIDGLITMVTQQVDAVHAVYYLLMRAFFGLTAIDPTLLRLASALLIGVAVAGAVVLGQRLVGRSAGILTGLVLMLLPAVTDMGVEARSYPWSVAVATWLTVVLVMALEDGRKRWWLGYGLLASLMVALFLNSALVVVAHGLTVLIARRGLRSVVGFAVAAAGAALLASPVVLLSAGQRGQVAWIHEVRFETIGEVIVEQWFRTAVGFAIVAWLVAIVVVVVGLTRAPRLRPMLVVVLPWLLLPTTLLVAVSLIEPFYTPRYLATGAPAIALLVGTGLSLVPWRAVRVLGVLGLAALTAGTYMAQRDPFRYGNGWRETAAFLEDRFESGDAVLFNEEVYTPFQYTRGMNTVYGDRLQGYEDIALEESHRTNGRLRDELVEPEVLEERLNAVDSVWVVWPDSMDWNSSEMLELLSRAGLTMTDAEALDFTEVRRFERLP